MASKIEGTMNKKPDSAGEELEMDDWAQEGWSSSLVVPGRHPATERFLVGGDE